MARSQIEWTQETWNPTKGCTKVSAGCKFCYAEVFARRLQAMGMRDYYDGFRFRILPHRLNYPLTVSKPTIFFVNSMSDLFHEECPWEFIDKVFAVIRQTPQHIYQILTKRAEIMRDYFISRGNEVPPNVWLGVTVESKSYKKRINLLREINAPIRFLSCEPLISDLGKLDLRGIHWVIVGGESGPNARPMKKEWVLNIMKQCKEQNVKFFFKQWGTWGEDGKRRSKKANGALLNGKEYREMPLTFSS